MEDGIVGPLEELGRDWVFEVVEPDVEVAELGDIEQRRGEQPNEAVVARVELVELSHVPNLLWDDPAEPVELRWSTARSSRSPISFGRYPATSAAFMLSVATAIFDALCRDGRQNTPL